jgi:hypothetical protein
MSKQTEPTKPTAATKAAPRSGNTSHQLLAAANLPEPITQRIAAIVRATRLWQSERADIARELIAHAQDALSAGRTPEDTAESLGDPSTVAKLLRRSAKRKRPWHWQVRHRTLQTIGISLLAIFATYAVLFVRFNTGGPTIKHNYIAELNERNSAFPESQHALPAYDALAIAWSPIDKQLSEEANILQQADPDTNTAIQNIPLALPTDPGYDQLIAAHRQLLPKINETIAASRLPTLGALYSDRYEEVTDEHGHTRYRMLPPTDNPALGGNLIEVLLPWLGDARNIARLIAFDAVLAARADNPRRAAESLTAVFDTARLVGREHTVIASLVAMAIQSSGENVVLHILHNHPDLLTESHLTAITHTAAVSGRIARNLDFETERRMFGDFLQRAYTDDGRGDGRLTAEGVRLALQMSGIMPGEPDDIARTDILPMRFTGPVAMLTFGSRRDQREMHTRLMDLADALLAESPGSAKRQRLLEQVKDAEHELANPRVRIAAMLTPVFTRAVDNAHRAKAATDAALATIAVHIHHHRTGRWPATLAELTPHLLPAIPEDPFDPGQPIKYRLIDNTPHIYFVGADGVDNHATRPTDPATIKSVSSLDRRYAQDPASPAPIPSDPGDWIIFPPIPEP